GLRACANARASAAGSGGARLRSLRPLRRRAYIFAAQETERRSEIAALHSDDSLGGLHAFETGGDRAMKLRISLSTKILALAMLNLLLLGATLVGLAGVQLQDMSSVLLAPTRDRVLADAR